MNFNIGDILGIPIDNIGTGSTTIQFFGFKTENQKSNLRKKAKKENHRNKDYTRTKL